MAADGIDPPTAGIRPSMLLFGASGGSVVDNRNIAGKLAQLILERVIGSVELSAHLPLSIEDRGDRWLITGSQEATGPGACDLEIRKRDAAVMISDDRELLSDPAIAEKFAAAILENAYGETELRRQSPLIVHDRGKTWLVRGSGNENRAVEGPGPFELEVQKHDAGVLDMWFGWVLNTPPEVQALLRASARKPREKP